MWVVSITFHDSSGLPAHLSFTSSQPRSGSTPPFALAVHGIGDAVSYWRAADVTLATTHRRLAVAARSLAPEAPSLARGARCLSRRTGRGDRTWLTLAAVASGHRFLQGIDPGALAEDLGQRITLERGRQDVAAERDFGVVGPGYPAALRRGKGPRRASTTSRAPGRPVSDELTGYAGRRAGDDRQGCFFASRNRQRQAPHER